MGNHRRLPVSCLNSASPSPWIPSECPSSSKTGLTTDCSHTVLPAARLGSLAPSARLYLKIILFISTSFFKTHVFVNEELSSSLWILN